MKKSRITKLALLGVSTAALVGTLSTSTYAWYVSNKQATVAEMKGSTSAGSADGSILISWDNSDNSYYKSLSWTDSTAPKITTTTNNVTKFTNSLSPVLYDATNKAFKAAEAYTPATAYDSTKTYYTESSGTFTSASISAFADGTTYYTKTGGDAAASTTYITFSMYIKADASTSVTITPTFANTTADVTNLKQVAYVATGSSSNAVSQGQSFIVDAFDAMYYSVAVDTADPTVVAVSGTKIASGTTKPADAHNYYEAVTGNKLSTEYKTEPTATSLSTITVGTTPVKLTWTIWLAGNDVDCYNSCAGQDFTFAVKYTA